MAARGGPTLIVGWREWVSLPELGVDWIKAKVDSGARSSSLHAYELEQFRQRGAPWVRFRICPLQRAVEPAIDCQAPLLEMRTIRSSNGHQSQRPVIVTQLSLLGQNWPIELTLAARDEMGFRMLLGRQALRQRLLIDPGKSYLAGSGPGRKKPKRAR